ncbi:MAG TPA: phospholipase D family protein [Gaiellales bacterium]|jgi:phosphatidylserine/phosphatidylglycerophosphate/cardiolipin synthase-like enzyme|nr:phospholipase D family protein [Gaiellales bacterium]
MPLRDTAEAIDRRVGDAVSTGVRAHHARRLSRLGNDALEAPGGGWAEDAFPPRQGNQLELLIDGEQALERMIESLERATAYVHISGWFMSPDFVMRDGSDPVVVRNLLAKLAERIDVRVLLWAGAPVPLFRPSRRMARQTRAELVAAGRIRCELDPYERPLHCHHEKTIVIDGREAFVGGIDLTSLSGDRRDSSRHPARAAVGWHDVAAVVSGPVVADVAEHFALRWHGVTGERLAVGAPAPAAGSSTVQLVRTVPERVYGGLRQGSFGVLESYVRAIRSAQRLIYIESQYLWSPEIVALLAEKLRDPPHDKFRMLLVLPGRPKGGTDDTRGALAELITADDGAGRVLACSLYAPAGSVSDLIYVHAKVGVIDDRVLIVGSANLNDHSMFNDTEAALVTDDAELATATRHRLWAEHLECSLAEASGDATELIDQVWRPRCEEQYQRRRAGRPMTHRISRIDGASRRSARLLGPLQGLLVDG